MQLNLFNKIAEMKDITRYNEIKNTLNLVARKHNISINKSEKSNDRKHSDKPFKLQDYSKPNPKLHEAR